MSISTTLSRFNIAFSTPHVTPQTKFACFLWKHWRCQLLLRLAFFFGPKLLELLSFLLVVSIDYISRMRDEKKSALTKLSGIE